MSSQPKIIKHTKKQAAMNMSEKQQTVESNPQKLQILDVSAIGYKTDMFKVFKSGAIYVKHGEKIILNMDLCMQ